MAWQHSASDRRSTSPAGDQEHDQELIQYMQRQVDERFASTHNTLPPRSQDYGQQHMQQGIYTQSTHTPTTQRRDHDVEPSPRQRFLESAIKKLSRALLPPEELPPPPPKPVTKRQPRQSYSSPMQEPDHRRPTSAYTSTQNLPHSVVMPEPYSMPGQNGFELDPLMVQDEQRLLAQQQQQQQLLQRQDLERLKQASGPTPPSTATPTAPASDKESVPVEAVLDAITEANASKDAQQSAKTRKKRDADKSKSPSSASAAETETVERPARPMRAARLRAARRYTSEPEEGDEAEEDAEADEAEVSIAEGDEEEEEDEEGWSDAEVGDEEEEDDDDFVLEGRTGGGSKRTASGKKRAPGEPPRKRGRPPLPKTPAQEAALRARQRKPDHLDKGTWQALLALARHGRALQMQQAQAAQQQAAQQQQQQSQQ